VRDELHDLMFSALAEALGMSVEELEAQLESEGGMMGVALAQGLSEEEARALFEEARASALEEAVAQGLIDEEQAERMLEHERGTGHGRRGPDGERPDVAISRAELHALMQPAIAEALGMSVEELESQMEEYDGPMEVAIAQGLSEEEARTLLGEAHSAAIQEAVEQGLIDEEQAEHMQEHVRGGDPGGRGPGRDAPMQDGCGRRGRFGQNGSDE
jgi:ribosomal protein S20